VRFYIGHRLPLGFFGGIGFGTYGGSRPTHVLHEDGTKTPVHGPSIYVTAFWLGFFALPLYIIFHALIYGWR
jgi:hypothetical protein